MSGFAPAETTMPLAWSPLADASIPTRARRPACSSAESAVPSSRFTREGRNATVAGSGSSGAVVNNRFQAADPGRTMLLPSPGSSPDFTNIFFQFVKTIVWNDTNYFRDTDLANIGDPITDPGHDAACGSQYVFDYLSSSYPWRYCADTNFYNRAARTGPVVPVGTVDEEEVMKQWRANHPERARAPKPTSAF